MRSKTVGTSFGLAVILLAICAASASAATVPAKWMAEGAQLVGAETISAGGSTRVYAKINKRAFEIECATNLTGSIVQVDQVESTLTFTGCTAEEPEFKRMSVCKFELAPAVLKGQVVGIVGVSYILYVPKAGETWTTITIGECVGFNGGYQAKGNTCAEGPALGGELVEQEVNWSEFALKKCFGEVAKYQGVTQIVGIKVQGEPALFTAKVKAKMTRQTERPEIRRQIGADRASFPAPAANRPEWVHC